MADDPRNVAHTEAAPAGERYDAQAELGRIYRPLASQLIPPSDIQPIINMIRDGLEEDSFIKGAKVIPFPTNRGTGKPNARGMQSVYLDNLQIFTSGEYFEKPNPIGFEGLRQMVEATPVLNSVVLTRLRQIGRFCQPSEDGGPGFEIRHVDRKHKLTGSEQESARLLSKFFANCGWEFNPTKRKTLRRDNFRQFILKSYRDSLCMDAAPIERELKKDKRLGLDGFYAIDGTTVRLCTEEGYQGDDQISALQVVQGRVTTAYSWENLVYEVRNPRADVRLTGYGLGEPELLVRVVTGFLNAMTMNIDGFDKNAIPRGILHLVGDYGNEDLADFKRRWNAMVRGINNAWTLPVMVNKDPQGKATYEKFGVDFDEMMFSKWMTFLTSIICAIYGMSPEEINFESFSAAKSSLSGSDTTEKLANSKDSGLRPDMAYYEATLTDFIVADFHPDLCFRWVGLEERDENRTWDAKKLVLTVDELRAEEGYEPWSQVNVDGPDMGSAPLNPSLMGSWMQAQQAQQQPDFGSPDGEQPGGEQGAPAATVPAAGEDDRDAPGAGGEDAGAAPADAGQGDRGDFGAGGEGDFGKALTPDCVFSVGE